MKIKNIGCHNSEFCIIFINLEKVALKWAMVFELKYPSTIYNIKKYVFYVAFP